MTEPTDPEQIRADMRKCPRWVLDRLKIDRSARLELEKENATLKRTIQTLQAQAAELNQLDLSNSDEAARALHSQFVSWKSATEQELQRFKVALEQKTKRVADLEKELQELGAQKDDELRRAQQGIRLLSSNKPSAHALLELQEQLDEKTAETVKQESRIERKRQQLKRLQTLFNQMRDAQPKLRIHIQERIAEKMVIIAQQAERIESLQGEIDRITKHLRAVISKNARATNAERHESLRVVTRGRNHKEKGSSGNVSQLVDLEEEQMDKEIRDLVQLAKCEESTELNLSRRTLNKFPSELASLQLLARLDLSYNSITEVPQSFKYLVLLEELYLNNNKLHEIPAVLFQTARQLKVLDLSTNYIATLPDLFGNLRLLKTLLLSYNKISTVPNSFSMLTNLELLDLSFNNLETLPKKFYSLIQLNELYLSGNNFRSLSEDLKFFNRLMVLDFSNNKLNVIPPEWYVLEPSLHELRFEKNPLIDPPENITSQGMSAVFKYCKAKCEVAGIHAFGERKSSDGGKHEIDMTSILRRATAAPSTPSSATPSSPSAKTSPRLQLQLGEAGLTKNDDESDMDSPRAPEPLPERVRRPAEPDTIGRRSHQLATKAAATTRTDILVASIRFEVEPFYTPDLLESDPLQNPELEDFDFFADYERYFYRNAHANFLARDQEGQILVSILKKAPAEDEEQFYRCLIRTSEKDERVFIHTKHVHLNKRSQYAKAKTLLQVLQTEYDYFPDVTFCELPGEANHDILVMEERFITNCHKHGLLYVKANQTEENEFFCNTETTVEYACFLDWLGDRIQLKGWGAYAGGLDTRHGNTGDESLYAVYHGLEVMFHVSTMLPYSPLDPQQLHRKRHLGNDIVILVYCEEGAIFDPSVIHSMFNHVFVVVRPTRRDGNLFYRVEVAHKHGVLCCKPVLPDPPEFILDDAFRDYLLCKLINCERAAYGAPGFKKAITRTRAEFLKELQPRYMAMQRRSFMHRSFARLGLAGSDGGGSSSGGESSPRGLSRLGSPRASRRLTSKSFPRPVSPVKSAHETATATSTSTSTAPLSPSQLRATAPSSFSGVTPLSSSQPPEQDVSADESESSTGDENNTPRSTPIPHSPSSSSSSTSSSSTTANTSSSARSTSADWPTAEPTTPPVNSEKTKKTKKKKKKHSKTLSLKREKKNEKKEKKEKDSIQ